MIMNKLLILLLNFSYINVLAENEAPVATNFCSDFGSTLKLVSYSILIVRTIVPLLIIAMGTFDLYKAVTSGKDDDLKNQIITLGKRIVIGFAVFFLPTFVNLVVDAFNKQPADYKTCLACISNPSNCPKSNNK